MPLDGGQTSSGNSSFHFDHKNKFVVVDTLALSTECRRCCRRFGISEMDEHKQSLVCRAMCRFHDCELNDCQEVLFDRDKLLGHMAASHGYHYACDKYYLCKRRYANLPALKMHQINLSAKCAILFPLFPNTPPTSDEPSPKKRKSTSSQPSTTSTQPAAMNMDFLPDNTCQTSNRTPAFPIDNNKRLIMVDTVSLMTECPRCCYQFGNKKALAEHTRMYACAVYTFRCNVKGCKDVFLDTKNLLEHLTASHGYHYACFNYNSCKRFYGNLKDLKRHQTNPKKKHLNLCYRSPHTSAEPSPKKTKKASRQPAATSTKPAATSNQPSTTSTQPAATNMEYLPDNNCESMSPDGDETSSGNSSFHFDHKNKFVVVDTVALSTECPRCCRRFDISDMDEHKQSLVCRAMCRFHYCKLKNCQDVFFDRDNLFGHMEACHGYHYACYKYNLCGRSYVNLPALKTHQISLSAKCAIPFSPFPTIPPTSDEPSPKKKKSTSSQPSTTSTQPAAMNMYFLPDNTLQLMSQDGGQMSKRAPAFSIDNDKQLIMVDTVLLMTECPVCNCRFHYEKERSCHLPCIVYKFHCSVEGCPMIFPTRLKLFSHVKNIHMYRYACDNYELCKRDFTYLHQLKEHQTTSSTANCPNLCYRCSYFLPESARSTSTQPTATSTQPPATSTQHTTTSTQPAATSTQPAATSTQPATTSTQPPATSTQHAATSNQSNTSGVASALQLSPALMSSSYSSDEFIISSVQRQKRAISMYGEPTFQCHECNRLFPTRQQLSEHMCQCLFRS